MLFLRSTFSSCWRTFFFLGIKLTQVEYCLRQVMVLLMIQWGMLMLVFPSATILMGLYKNTW